MSTIKLQIPIDKSLKERSLKRAKALGFNSLQDLTRVLLAGFADSRTVSFGEDDWGEPTPEAAARLNRWAEEAVRDSKAGKLKSFTTVEEMMAHLRSL